MLKQIHDLITYLKVLQFKRRQSLTYNVYFESYIARLYDEYKYDLKQTHLTVHSNLENGQCRASNFQWLPKYASLWHSTEQENICLTSA